VAQTCRRELVRWQNRLDLYGTRVLRLHETGANLQFEQFNLLIIGFRKLVNRYQGATARVEDACRPG
jgi:hypothetical protein